MADGDLGQRKVYKDSAVTAMDEFLGGTGGVPLSQALEFGRRLLADTSQSLAELTAQAARQQPGGVSIDEEQARHFATHWDQQAQEEMRRAYTAAIDLATEDVLLPIETFWVTGPNERFQIFARRGPRQVTVLVFIPPDVEERARADWTRDDITPSDSAS
jgi:hypothetical protein